MLNETSRVTGCQGVALQLHTPVKASALNSACAVLTPLLRVPSALSSSRP